MLGSQTQAVVFKDYDVIKAVILWKEQTQHQSLSAEQR